MQWTTSWRAAAWLLPSLPSSPLQGSSEQGEKGRGYREPLRRVQCADGEGTHGSNVVPSQRSERRAGCQKECPCQFKDGQKLVAEFDLMEPNTFDAKNGAAVIRAGFGAALGVIRNVVTQGDPVGLGAEGRGRGRCARPTSAPSLSERCVQMGRYTGKA